MTIEYNALEVEVDLQAIRHNYRVLCENGSKVYVVLKADAYGHGLLEVFRALEKEGADTFAVGTVREGVALRMGGCKKRIISLLGPLSTADCSMLVEHGIIPFIGGFEQLDMFALALEGVREPVEISLKFDTGMCRLGFSPDDLPRLIAELQANPFLHPVLASSHLASADDPAQEESVRKQIKRFAFILEGFESAGIKVEASLANSAGIIVHEQAYFNAQRAGIALYGANPLSGTKWESLGEKLKPAMQVRTRIISIRKLRKGESISYGLTYTAERDMTVAIACAGYADGYSRGLSNTGWMCVKGVRAKILGRVCMQLSALDITDIPDVNFGDEVYLLGGEGKGSITLDELSLWWGTIPHEILCLFGLSPKTFVGQE